MIYTNENWKPPVTYCEPNKVEVQRMTREEAISRIQQALDVPNRLQGTVLIDEESANMAIDALQYLKEWGDVLQGRPVKHGEWEECKNGWRCTACGKRSERLSDFCPNCGAKMDKE